MDAALLDLHHRVMELLSFWPVLLAIPALTIGRIVWRDLQIQRRIAERYRRI